MNGRMHRLSTFIVTVVPFLLLLLCTQCTFGFHTVSSWAHIPHPFIYKSRGALCRSLSLSEDDSHNEEYYRRTLSPEAYYVLREDGTEAPWSSPLNDVKEKGLFRCAACDAPLLGSISKYESGSGWPSFTAPLSTTALRLVPDFKIPLMPRTDCRCAKCESHIGHIFEDGPPPTGQRFCMNGVALQFQPTAEEEEEENNVDVITIPLPLPRSMQWTNIATNAGVTFLFVTSFVRHDHRWGLHQDVVLQTLDAITLVGALYYAYMTAKSIIRGLS